MSAERPVGHKAFDVTDDGLDAPDGAEVEIGGRNYRRVGMQWVPIASLYVPRRAKGGQRIHAVDLARGRSACGHKPVDTARKMRTRCGWVEPGWDCGGPVCPHCSRKLVGHVMGDPQPPVDRLRMLPGKVCARVAELRDANVPWDGVAERVRGWTVAELAGFFGTATPTE